MEINFGNGSFRLEAAVPGDFSTANCAHDSVQG